MRKLLMTTLAVSMLCSAPAWAAADQKPKTAAVTEEKAEAQAAETSKETSTSAATVTKDTASSSAEVAGDTSANASATGAETTSADDPAEKKPAKKTQK